MTFIDPYVLVALGVVPVLLLVRYFRRRRVPAVRFSSAAIGRAVPRTLWVRLAGLPFYLRLLAIALAIVAAARPVQRDTTHRQETEGIDILLILDTSTSMLAQDFHPNRFESARKVASEFIQGRTSDRIGLVVFAGRAFTQAPLTLDYGFLHSMLAEVRTGIIEDGTAIGTAIVAASNRLRKSEAKSKVAILLTDGQNNRGEVDPATAAEVAASLGIRIYTIGVGKRGLAPFVVGHPFGGKQIQMLPVEIDEPMLQRVASTTGGRYYRATDESALRAVYDEIGRLEKSRVDDSIYTDVTERYPWFLWPAFGLLALQMLLSLTRLRPFPS